MTLHAAREGEFMAIQCTYGSVTFRVLEDISHVGNFWHQVGVLLAEDPGHREARARRAFERYREHAGGVSAVSGEELPTWEEQAEHIREHWRHAVS